jgi:hypothetical protein
VSQGNYGGVFLGCYAFQYGWIWQATATWVNMVKCVVCVVCARLRALRLGSDTCPPPHTTVALPSWYPFTFTSVAGGYDGAGSTLPGAWAKGNEQAEVVDTIAYMFTGAYPNPRAPTIPSALGLQVNGQDGPQNINLLAGANYSAFVNATDPGGYQLGYQCVIDPRAHPRTHRGDFLLPTCCDSSAPVLVACVAPHVA